MKPQVTGMREIVLTPRHIVSLLLKSLAAKNLPYLASKEVSSTFLELFYVNII